MHWAIYRYIRVEYSGDLYGGITEETPALDKLRWFVVFLLMLYEFKCISVIRV